jgi:hypothetical protein
MHLRRVLATMAAARDGLVPALAATRPRRILTATVLAGVALAATPATAQAAQAQSTAARPGSAVADTVPVVADAAPGSTHGVLVSQQDSQPSFMTGPKCGWHLLTGYGPIARCTSVDVVGGVVMGRALFHSAITGEYNPTTGWFPVHEARWFSWNGGTIIGYTSLHTAYGPTVWATQRSGSSGRWGTVNLITSTFYAESGWFPLA